MAKLIQIAKAWGRPGTHREMLIEAMLNLLLARLALKLLSFRRLIWLLERRPSEPQVTGTRRARLRQEVRWAIATAARYLPGETVCFPRAIAAQAMLRRRRVGTMLYYGAARLPGRGLTTHAWVQDGAAGVVGHRNADKYYILARYPATGSLALGEGEKL